MNLKKITYIVTIILLFSFTNQKSENNSNLEKIYAQTDRPMYYPSETIWFKAYVTNAVNKVSTISDIVTVQLISPKGTVVNTEQLRINQGAVYSNFNLKNDWVGGIYKLRFFTNWMKNFGTTSFFEKEIVVQKIVNPNLLMKLEFGKKAYGQDANVIANFEVKDLKNNPLINKKLRFVVQLKGKAIISKSFITNEKGEKAVQFKLPNELKSTDAILTILIPFNGITESISRAIPITLNNIDLQFMPESGKAIIGLENKIAFKAVNEFGKPADISGDILDENNNKVGDFLSFHNGMGSFQFTPKNTNYYARITKPFLSKKLIELPKFYQKGTSFKVTQYKDNFEIYVFSNIEKKAKLIISNSHKQIFEKQLQFINNKAKFSIPKDKFVIGIHKISVLNLKENLLAERLLFLNENKQLQVKITLEKEEYNTREKVIVKIKTTDENNKPIPSNLSVSVADNKLVSFADDKQDNILSSLLLSSELKGKIEKPSFYFDKTEKKSIKALDLIMLTHGWRNYINNNELTFKNAKFLPFHGTKKYGQVFYNYRNPIKANVILFDETSKKAIKLITNSKGQFEFEVEKNKSIQILVYTDDNKRLHTVIKDEKPAITENDSITKSNKERRIKKYKKEQESRKENKKPFEKPIEEEVIVGDNNLNVTMETSGNSLDEVVVTALGIRRSAKALGYATTNIRSDMLNSQNTDNIGQILQGKVAGIQITSQNGLAGSGTNISIRGQSNISGNSQPLIIVDGAPVSNLSEINPDNIQSINVLKGIAASSLYGSNGMNGVIIINTNWNYYNYRKTFNKKRIHKFNVTNYTNYNRSGYNSYSQFYVPIYDSEKINKNRTDFRQTIYWNPIVQTDENGEASIEYYNSDAITSFLIATEGIGYNGLVGRNETTYASKKLLNLSFKMPSYLVMHDTINVDVVIKNESNKPISTNLRLNLSKEIIRFKDTINKPMLIEANSFKIKRIQLIPIEESKNAKVRISISGENCGDVVENKLTIVSPYYPTKSSFSGFKDNDYTFNINAIANNSLKTNLTVYTDISAQVIDGMESLIREPHGCFEQVSAVTYPNALILKYLRENNKHDIKTERKARRFVRRGYKKLVAFETEKNGFEWYGRPKPVLTLTALALMQFEALKDVYNKVDAAMITRTQNYIFNQKDGKGGFIKDKKEYYYIKDNVARNAYIIYALSESGIVKGYEKEFQFAYQDALKSKDSYRLALMANACFNYNKVEDANKLLAIIKQNIIDFGYDALPIESTMTNSWGNSKYLETVAFTIMALLKENKSELLTIKSVNYLISNRRYGRFGSSQSTAMSLKALIAFAEKQEERNISKDAFVALNINGQIIKKMFTESDTGKLVFEELDKYFIKGKQQISINFSDKSEFFPYEFNARWSSTIPDSSKACNLNLETILNSKTANVGDNVRLQIKVKNKTNKVLPTGIAIVGIPSGTAVQMWQLKEIIEQKKVDHFEISENYIIFYWNAFNKNETKKINLDLKVEIAGKYRAPASTTYLYYQDEFKHWITGNEISILN